MARFGRLGSRGAVLGAGLAFVGAVALAAMGRAEGDTISACVNRSSGEIKIVGAGATCHGHNYDLLEWNVAGVPGPPGKAGAPGPAGPPGPAGATTFQYVFGGMYPGTSVARAFCPPGTLVAGGGGASSGPGLRYSFPISDETGVFAFGTTAIGWQVAAGDFSDVQAFVVCAGP